MLNTVTETAPMTIADRVKQLRKEHGLTQEDLAAKAGLGVATIQRVERGEHPSAATTASIASGFRPVADCTHKCQQGRERRAYCRLVSPAR